jgi:hypothetical protein
LVFRCCRLNRVWSQGLDCPLQFFFVACVLTHSRYKGVRQRSGTAAYLAVPKCLAAILRSNSFTDYLAGRFLSDFIYKFLGIVGSGSCRVRCTTVSLKLLIFLLISGPCSFLNIIFQNTVSFLEANHSFGLSVFIHPTARNFSILVLGGLISRCWQKIIIMPFKIVLWAQYA